jgi:hypothetical protein
MKPFCNFCKCRDCVNGTDYLRHARVKGNKWICDVCWRYDVCVAAKRKEGKPGGDRNPCDDMNCKHRPKLIGEWEKKK